MSGRRSKEKRRYNRRPDTKSSLVIAGPASVASELLNEGRTFVSISVRRIIDDIAAKVGMRDDDPELVRLRKAPDCLFVVPLKNKNAQR